MCLEKLFVFIFASGSLLLLQCHVTAESAIILLYFAPFFHAFQFRNSWTLSVIAFLAWFLAHWAITSIKFQSFFSFRIFIFIHCVFFYCRHCICFAAKRFNQATKSWKYELLSIGSILTTPFPDSRLAFWALNPDPRNFPKQKHRYETEPLTLTFR